MMKEQARQFPALRLAIISNSIPPYRLHLHRRIARELKEVELWTVLTHDAGEGRWAAEIPPEIRPVEFGPGQTPSPSLFQKVWREWRKGGDIIRWMRRGSIDAVVMCGYNDAGRLRVVRWCAKRQIPCFLSADSNARGDRSRGALAVAKRVALRQVLRWFTGVMPFGSLGEAYFAAYGVPGSRSFRFPLEPDYDLIQRIPPERAMEVAAAHGLSPARRRLIYSGRLTAVKRVDLLIDAFVRIAPSRPDWDLVIAGDGELRQVLAARVPAELRARVIWTGFINDPRDLAALYRACQALVLPSDFEPWALVVNEALAAGLAVVCSDVVGAAAELVQDGVNGCRFPAGAVEALTGCLLRVTDASNIERMRTASERILADWRREADPVQGLRQALIYSRLLPQ